MTFNKCSINGIVYGEQNEVRYGKSDDMVKVKLVMVYIITDLDGILGSAEQSILEQSALYGMTQNSLSQQNYYKHI